MKVISLLKYFIRKFWTFFAVALSLLSAQFLFDIASIFTIAPVIDFLIDPELKKASDLTKTFVKTTAVLHLPPALATFLGVFLAFQIFKSGFFIFANHSIIKIKYSVERDLLIGSFEDFFRARWLFFSGSDQGTVINTFIREINMIGDAFFKMIMFFSGSLNFVIFISVPLYIAWQATLMTMALGALFAYPLYRLGPVNYRLGLLNTSTANRLMTIIHESLVSAKVILGFGLQKHSLDNLKKAFDGHRDATVKSQTLGMATPLIYEPFGILAVFATILVAAGLNVPAAEIGVMVWAYMKAVPLIGNIVANKNAMNNLLPSYEQIVNLRKQAEQLRQESGSRRFSDFQSEIRFERVAFSYPGHGEILSDVNLSVPKGKMIAIVGESGAGKSTIIDMIMGFNAPDKGRVTIDGLALRDFDIESYRRRIGYVPQESVLFNLSVRDNLLWSKEDATEEEIWEALRHANAGDFILNFPNKLDTIVGDRGVRLSGGQCQRIALARAILRKPELLILDEATSSLDTQSERLIQQAVEEIAKETTVVVIAHRLSTIVHADYIYVVNKGTVVEEGRYEELMQNRQYFSRMAQMQEMGK